MKEGTFYTYFKITSLEFQTSLEIPACLSYCPVSYLVLCILSTDPAGTGSENSLCSYSVSVLAVGQASCLWLWSTSNTVNSLSATVGPMTLPVSKLRVTEPVMVWCLFDCGHVRLAAVSEWKFGFRRDAEDCDVAGIYRIWYLSIFNGRTLGLAELVAGT